MDLINLSTITGDHSWVIKGLEEGHYLQLSVIARDQRIKVISLTSKSLALFKRSDKLVTESIKDK